MVDELKRCVCALKDTFDSVFRILLSETCRGVFEIAVFHSHVRVHRPPKCAILNAFTLAKGATIERLLKVELAPSKDF